MPPARRGASSPNAPATPSQPAAKPAARKPAARKTAAAKPAARKAAAAKPAATRSAAAKPAASKSASAARSAPKKAAARKPAASRAKTSSAKKDSSPVAKAAREAQSAAEERFEAVAKRLRKLNDQIIEAARDRSETTLDSYEKALKAIANGIEKGPGKSDIDWISNLASAQAKFIRDVTKSWTDAARDALKK